MGPQIDAVLIIKLTALESLREKFGDYLPILPWSAVPGNEERGGWGRGTSTGKLALTRLKLKASGRVTFLQHKEPTNEAFRD